MVALRLPSRREVREALAPKSSPVPDVFAVFSVKACDDLDFLTCRSYANDRPVGGMLELPISDGIPISTWVLGDSGFLPDTSKRSVNAFFDRGPWWDGDLVSGCGAMRSVSRAPPVADTPT